MPWCTVCGAGFGYDNKPTCDCSKMDLERKILFRPGHSEMELLVLIQNLERRVNALEEK